MEVRKVFKDIATQSNPAQRVIVAFIMPAVIILLGWGLMSFIDSHYIYYDGMVQHKGWGWPFDPTNLNYSWWGWLLIILAIGVFEYLWFRTKSGNANYKYKA